MGKSLIMAFCTLGIIVSSCGKPVMHEETQKEVLYVESRTRQLDSSIVNLSIASEKLEEILYQIESLPLYKEVVK